MPCSGPASCCGAGLLAAASSGLSRLAGRGAKPYPSAAGAARVVINGERRTVFEDYDVGEVLGEGGFGVVSVAKGRQGGADRVIKVVDRSAVEDPVALDNEVAIHADLDHPNIVRVYESFRSESRFYIIMELCRGGELYEVVDSRGCVSEREAQVVFGQVVQAIRYMHCKGLAHRDVKLENFLLAERGAPLTENTVKLIDFGFAAPVVQGAGTLATICGTPLYMAPEVFHRNGYDEKCDMWSCGVLLHILLCGEAPFTGESVDEVIRSVRTGRGLTFAEAEWAAVSGEARSLTRRLCYRLPAKRWSAQQAMDGQWLREAQGESDREQPLITPEMCENARRFAKMSCFQKASLHRVAYHLDAAEVAPIREAFLQLDADRDGRLTLEELRQGLASRGDVALDWEAFFHEADADGSGTVEYTEFVTAMMNHKQCLRKGASWAAFKSMDKDGSGSIDVHELRKALSSGRAPSWGDWARPSEANAVLERADKNGDGQIDYQEFLDMIHVRSHLGGA